MLLGTASALLTSFHGWLAPSATLLCTEGQQGSTFTPPALNYYRRLTFEVQRVHLFTVK